MSSPEPEPIRSPVGALETARRESQQAAYKQLHATLQELDRLDVPVLEDSHLHALGIRKLPDIDVDEYAPFDPEPLFFSPYPLNGAEDVSGLVTDALNEEPTYNIGTRPWKKPCEKAYCPGDCIGLDRHCSCSRYQWVYEMAGAYENGLLGKTKWQYMK